MEISRHVNNHFIDVFLLRGINLMSGKIAKKSRGCSFVFFLFCIVFIPIKLHDKKWQILQSKKDIVLSYANLKEFVSWNVIPLMRGSFIFSVLEKGRITILRHGIRFADSLMWRKLFDITQQSLQSVLFVSKRYNISSFLLSVQFFFLTTLTNRHKWHRCQAKRRLD